MTLRGAVEWSTGAARQREEARLNPKLMPKRDCLYARRHTEELSLVLTIEQGQGRKISTSVRTQSWGGAERAVTAHAFRESVTFCSMVEIEQLLENDFWVF